MPNVAKSRQEVLPSIRDQSLAPVFVGYTVSATAWPLFSTFVGIVLAYKFGAPDFGRGAWLSFGRLRPIHTNATFYGWASIGPVGLAYYVALRSCRAPLLSTSHRSAPTLPFAQRDRAGRHDDPGSSFRNRTG